MLSEVNKIRIYAIDLVNIFPLLQWLLLCPTVQTPPSLRPLATPKCSIPHLNKLNKSRHTAKHMASNSIINNSIVHIWQLKGFGCFVPEEWQQRSSPGCSCHPVLSLPLPLPWPAWKFERLPIFLPVTWALILHCQLCEAPFHLKCCCLFCTGGDESVERNK